MKMWENVIQMAAETGIWAVLFVWLFFKQMKESKAREEKCQQMMEAFSEKLGMISEIKTDVEDIKSVLTEKDIPVDTPAVKQ